jgi:hypothetical protein
MPNPLEHRIIGAWRHAHEEDQSELQVFRPAHRSFAPSRGRAGYEFRGDHSVDVHGFSPRDGSARTAGTWRLIEGRTPELVITYPDGRTETLIVVTAEADRLVIRRDRSATERPRDDA